MTLTTDEGLEATGDLLKSAVAYLALGSGANEQIGASALGSREYAAQTSSSNVDLVETGGTGEFEAIIRVKGGTEVPGGTTISEMGVFDGDPAGNGTLLIVDEFSDIIVEAGHTEEFTIPVNPTRA